MIAFRLSVLIALTATGFAVLTAGGQPPGTPPPVPTKSLPDLKLGPGSPGIPGGTARPGQQLVDDYRRWLEGQMAMPKQKEIDPKLLKELMEKLPKEKQDQEQIKQWLKEHPEFQKDPDFMKQMNELKKSEQFPENLNEKLPKGVEPPPINNKDVFEENLKNVIDEGQKPQIGEGIGKVNPKIGPGEPPDGSKLPEFEKSNAADNEWVKWMQKNFGESEAGKSAVKDLMSALEKQDTKGMFDNIPEFKNGGWKDFDKWGKTNAGDLWKVKPPDMSGSKVSPPKMSSGSSGSSGWGGGSSGGGGGGSGWGGGGGLGGGGTALAVIAGIAGAIFLAVLLFRKWKLHQEEKAAAMHAVQNGIDFDSIRTREQLVHAFDHVSLDRIGDDARTWNHRVIADQFAEAKPAHAEPADQLAGLYERARYAPHDEDLSAGEFSDARRDLRVIAEVAV
jgi:uncharacterized membrane protein YgcG